jgi:hypothetical protein
MRQQVGGAVGAVVEGAWISRPQLEQPRELLGQPGVRPTIDLLPQLARNLGKNRFSGPSGGA